MEIKILAFGAIADLLRPDELQTNNFNTTDELRLFLENKLPAIKSISYAMAVNRKIVTDNVMLTNGDEVALLPPFSGG